MYRPPTDPTASLKIRHTHRASVTLRHEKELFGAGGHLDTSSRVPVFSNVGSLDSASQRLLCSQTPQHRSMEG